MRKNNLCEGDWNSTTLNGVQENRTHNDVHEMLTRGGNSVTTDAKGNITVNSNGQRYTWDADNMMSAVDINGDLTNDVTYVYDAGNRRIAKIANGTTTVFAYSDWQCVTEYDVSSTPVVLRKFAFGAYLDEPLMMASVSGANETLHFYHQNANFNVIALTDASGTIADRIAYSSYGQIVMITNGSTGNPWFFTGQRHDADTGLDYYKMRYYDSALGRFISRDPATSDLYEYVNSNPLMFVDVLGLDGAASQPTSVPAGPIVYNGRKLKEYDTMKKLRDAYGSGSDNILGFAKYDVTKFELEIKNVDGKCCLKVKRIEWHTEMHVPTLAAFRTLHKNWTWDDYATARSQADSEWYNNGKFRNYWGLRVHEEAHAIQFEAAAEKALKAYVQDFEKHESPLHVRCFDKYDRALEVLKIWDGHTAGAYLAINEEFIKQNPVGAGFKSDQYGEAGAVKAERAFLEGEYRKAKGLPPVSQQPASRPVTK